MKLLVLRQPFAILATVAVLAVTLGARAEESPPLPTTEARAFLGAWTLSMEIGGKPVEMKLEIVDSAGTVSATLTSPRARAPQQIHDIRKVGEHLKLSWKRPFNGRPLTLEIEVALEGGMLAGRFGDPHGMFETAITGTVVPGQ